MAIIHVDKIYLDDLIIVFDIWFLYVYSCSEMPVPYLTHIDVVEAGLEVLEAGRIQSATVESLRFMNNRIKIIDDNMFE